MSKTAINTSNAPKAIGPYSQAQKVNNLIFTSGQLPINPQTGEMPTDIKSQTKQSFENIKSILEAGNSSLSDVLKVTVLLADINDFTAMNEVYASYFQEPYPARTCYQVACLPKNALIEIDAIALCKS